MLLGQHFPCNNYNGWQEGMITVGGAGGAMVDGQFMMTGDSDTIRNEMVILNCRHCLPIEIAVEVGESMFAYIGKQSG